MASSLVDKDINAEKSVQDSFVLLVEGAKSAQDFAVLLDNSQPLHWPNIANALKENETAWLLCWQSFTNKSEGQRALWLKALISEPASLTATGLNTWLQVLQSDTQSARAWSIALLYVRPQELVSRIDNNTLRDDLHRLSTILFENSSLALGRLPILSWGPSSLCDDFGMPPIDVQTRQKAINNALEYAVCEHLYYITKDKTNRIEWQQYALNVGINPHALDVLLDLSNSASQKTFQDLVYVIGCMMTNSPVNSDYNLEAIAPEL